MARIEKSFTLSKDPHHGLQSGKHSYWEVADRIPPEAFVWLIEAASGAYNHIVGALVAMPAKMLVLPAAADHRSYTKYGTDWLPRPSAFWPGIAENLNMAILRAGRQHDVALLAALAQVPRVDQPGWWERAQVSPAVARRVFAAPAWARVYIEGDQGEAARIWEALCCVIQSVTYDRPNADPTALAQMTGAQVNWIGGLTFNGDPTRTRWRSAFLQAGFALEHGQATLADFVFNQTGKGAPWTRW